VVEDGESDGSFADSTRTYEGNRGKSNMFGETNELLDEIVASETRPGGRGR
jgi:hypothetical protein